ncbi:hypothetical protein BT96DRAFT_1026479 [Gymnopus androsaceus JB14]|uniref:F-box domain-containing protein n=1 Tax=Gymnopus androsaceus JB14 TaxID=1447944 RepID=A0A6A4GK51_9AGAR|nr:hypothetical protein BT96DRAFT_1026479 [Gymnopus androsaceus JB14]
MGDHMIEPRFFLSMMMLLPEELVHDIFSYVACRSEPRIHCEPPELQFEHNSLGIRSLSLVNRRWRRISMPFLFSSLRINVLIDVKKLRDQRSLFSKYTKTLILRMLSLLDKEGMEILLHSLPHLKRLVRVDVGSELTITLLNALHEHSSVSTILVASIPKEATQSDLSKVILLQSKLIDPSHSRLAPMMARGMEVFQLLIHHPELISHQFGSQTFNGLCELDLLMSYLPVTVSWLPEFTAAHPNLKKIRFIYGRKDFFSRYTLPFISLFVEEARSRQLADAYSITRLSITRSFSTQEWRVTGLTIIVRSSVIEILSLLSSFFPEIQTLSLKFEGRPTRGLTYHIDDAIAILHLFSSLEILALHCLFKRLHFGNRKPWHALARVGNTGQFEPSAADITEAGLLWYTLRIAQRIPSLQAFEIHEEAYYDEEFCCGGRWFVKGWLHVQNAPSGGREVVGTLKKT